MFYIPNDSSIIGDIPCLIWRWVWPTTGKLRPRTCTTITFWSLKSIRPVASKLKVVRPGSGSGLRVGVLRSKMGVSGSGCGLDDFPFPSQLQSGYATMFPYLTFWNYESSSYENVATAIHKLKRSSTRYKSVSVSMLQYSGVHRPHIQHLHVDQVNMARSDVEYHAGNKGLFCWLVGI